MALKFGVSMCYFSNQKLAKFARKKTKYGFFILGARKHSKKNSEKNKPSSLIVMISQYTKNLRLKVILQHNDIGNFKILQLFL